MSSDANPNLLSHHAHYLVGGDLMRAEIISILESHHSILIQANPDFFDRNYQTFAIDDAREVKTFHGMRPVTEVGKKIFVLQMNGITVEAQNALLKLLEEPAEYAHFFLIIPSTHLLLPTVKSRMSLLEIGTDINSELSGSAKKFVTLSKAKRLDEIKKLVEDITKEKKTKQDAIDFLNAIQAVIYEEKGVKEGKSTLEVIETARMYIHDRAPSVKMLLEYVALNV